MPKNFSFFIRFYEPPNQNILNFKILPEGYVLSPQSLSEKLFWWSSQLKFSLTQWLDHGAYPGSIREKFCCKKTYKLKMLQKVVRPWADSNHRSPVYKTGALTAMLQSRSISES